MGIEDVHWGWMVQRNDMGLFPFSCVCACMISMHACMCVCMCGGHMCVDVWSHGWVWRHKVVAGDYS